MEHRVKVKKKIVKIIFRGSRSFLNAEFGHFVMILEEGKKMYQGL